MERKLPITQNAAGKKNLIHDKNLENLKSIFGQKFQFTELMKRVLKVFKAYKEN